MKKIFAILLGVMFWSNAHAQSSENLRKIETYLNNIRTEDYIKSNNERNIIV